MRKANRCIPKKPPNQVFYLVDANVLIYKFIDATKINDQHEQKRAHTAQSYWNHIDAQRKAGLAKVFVLDVCIAEAFKTLSKKNYDKSGLFPYPANYKNACDRLRKEVQLTTKEARKSQRIVTFHDIQTNQDIIVGIDRFFEMTHKKKKRVGVIDLLILSTAKYLTDFFGMNRDHIYIITMDGPLYDLARSYPELPSAFNPDRPTDNPMKVFI